VVGWTIYPDLLRSAPPPLTITCSVDVMGE
jgi:hypothetical protein